MADTIPGGKYISADGKTYHEANGKKIGDVENPITPNKRVTKPFPKAEPTKE